MQALIRLILSLVLVLFGLVGYCGNTTMNPITGEKQKVALSPQQEIVLGLQSREQMAAQHGGLYPDQILQTYLDEVGARVVQRSDAVNSPYRYEFHLLRDPETVNAFALPGGQIFMTAGLLKRLTSEAQVAAVLGHEVGHVVARHGAEHLAKQQLGQALVTAVGVATDSRNSAVMAQAVNQMVGLKYGREDEKESDRLGLRFITEAGYDPRGILEVMQVLASVSRGGRQAEFFSSHPNPENRLKILQDLIQKAYPQGLPNTLEDGRDRFMRGVLPRLRAAGVQ